MFGFHFGNSFTESVLPYSENQKCTLTGGVECCFLEAAAPDRFFGEIHETCINSNNSFINKACICSGQWPEFIFGKHYLNLDLNT